MSTEPRPAASEESAVRNYTLICVAALFVILLSQQGDLTGLLTLLPILAGAIGLAMRSSTASAMLLLTLGGKIFLVDVFGTPSWFRRGFLSSRSFQFTDILLCAGVLAYVMAHYRLTGLVGSIFPRDPRRPGGKPDRDGHGETTREPDQKRSKRLVGPTEFAVLLVALPACVLVGQLVWKVLPRPWADVYIPLWLAEWTGLILPAFVLAALLLVAWGLFGYWGRRGMSVQEGEIMLQDVIWHETRREQRWITRWLAWARLRRQREEKVS
jgi:hypothetical protein